MDVNIASTLRQPEYTGNNRCIPCKVLNVAIAAIGGLALSRKSRVGDAIAIALSLGLIHLRGYPISGTSTLTKQYLPSEVLGWFGKEPEEPPVMSGLGATTDQTESSSTEEIQTKESNSASISTESIDTTETGLQEIEPETYFDTCDHEPADAQTRPNNSTQPLHIQALTMASKVSV